MVCYDCCHEWYHGECVSQEDVISRDNEKYVCALCLQSSNDQFIHWPISDQSFTSFRWDSCSGPEFCDTASYI